MAPPPRISHTWLPSHTGPTLLMTTRRSMSLRAANGSSMPLPRSKPSVTAKPTSSTPISSHQMKRRVS
jgi:hypothetical protein